MVVLLSFAAGFIFGVIIYMALLGYMINNDIRLKAAFADYTKRQSERKLAKKKHK